MKKEELTGFIFLRDVKNVISDKYTIVIKRLT